MYWPSSPRPYNALCLHPQILHSHCFQFLLGITVVPREIEDNGYAKFGGKTRCIMISVKIVNIVYIWEYLKCGQVLPIPLNHKTQHGNINLKTTFIGYFLNINIFNYFSLRNVHCLDKFHRSRKQTLTL